MDRALREQSVVRAGRGRYTLPDVEEAAAIAHGANGVLALTSAALAHGWEVKEVPEKPHVLFPRKRRVPEAWRSKLIIHRGDLADDDVSDGATSRELTLAQCLRVLLYDEALAIADSALRHGEQATLRRAVALVRGRGQTRAARVGRDARAEAANPFESVLRAICNDVPGLEVEPQVVISCPHCWARPDLVARERRLIVEGESFEWHATRDGFRKDIRRYTLLAVEGWLILRFTWEDAMHRPEWVREVLTRAVVEPQTLVCQPLMMAA